MMGNKNRKFNINDYKTICKEEITSLNENEKNNINEFVNKLVDKIQNDKTQIIDNEDIDFEKIRWKNGIFCPWCKSKEYWLNGQSKKVKLYKCKVKTCRKTFSFMSNSFLSGSNLSLHKWSTYIKCFVQKLTCRQSAVMTGIHFVTAWKNRHRILKWLIRLVQETKLNGDVILDEFFVSEVYKGRWKPENKPKRLIEKQKFYEAHKGKLRGLSRFKVCIMTGINEKKEFFFKIAKFGKLSFKIAFEILNKMLGKVNQITSDKEQAYSKYTTVNNIKHIAVKARTGESKVLHSIDNLHYSCRKFLKKFYGIDYHYISRYTTWFKFLKLSDSDFFVQKNALVEKLLIF